MDSHNFLHKQLINVQFTSRENNSRAMDHTVEWQPSLGSQKNKNGCQSFLFLFVGTDKYYEKQNLYDYWIRLFQSDHVKFKEGELRGNNTLRAEGLLKCAKSNP